MTKWTKKPVEVDADQYVIGMEDGFDKEAPELVFSEYKQPAGTKKKGFPFIETLEGKHYISDKDYIITGIKGERYPCKEDIFLESYDKVEKLRDGSIFRAKK